MKRNASQGFVHILILVSVLASGLLGGTGYFAIGKYQAYQAKQQAEKAEEKRLSEESEMARLERERQTNELIAAQQLLLEETKKELASLKSESRTELESAKSAAAQKIAEIERQLEAARNSQIDLSAIIARWRPFISSIRCDFRYASTGELYEIRNGSGVLYKFSDGRTTIITSKHIVKSSKSQLPSSCGIKFPDSEEEFSIETGNIEVSSDYDFAYLDITLPNSYVSSLNTNLFTPCSNKASVGESLVIIGYPRIGTKGDITATEGIISGYDRDFYITSAKVESGNSGGAAINLKNNCYLGIPTFTRVGTAESLARILDRKTAIHLQSDQ